MNKNLIIISESACFPWGMAASTRVRCLSKAAMMFGWNTSYIGLRGANVNRKQTKHKHFGWEDGIHYCYPGVIAKRPSNWWLRRIDDLLGFMSTILLIVLKKFFRKINLIIICSNSMIINWFWIEFSHFLKIPVILELCEWPPAISDTKRKGSSMAEKFCFDILPKADAVMPISTYIDSKINTIAKQKGIVIPSFIIPILIDNELSEISNNTTLAESQFMLYCGSIQYIDIAMIVVDIVFELKKLDIELPVIFTGNVDDSRFTELKKYADKKQVLSLFKFTGFIKEKILFRLMRQAICLLAPLPENRQSQSRFPTKIGYYLASARPVVTNAIGDIDNYLRDNLNAFVTENCDAKQFALKIEYILNNREISDKIGKAGRSLAMKNFHFSAACTGFGQFLQKTVKNFSTKFNY